MAKYLSNQPAGVYGGVTWGEGSDLNNGDSPLTPYLTANVAFDAFVLSENDGEDLIINEGVYTYTNNDGRWVVFHDFCRILPQVEWATHLIFSGTSAQGFRYNSSSATDREFTMGKFLLSTLGATKVSCAVLSGNGATQNLLTVNWEARLLPNPANIGGQIGIDIQASNCKLNILDGGCLPLDGSLFDASTAGTYRAISYSSSIVHVHFDFDLHKWPCNIKCDLVGSAGFINLDSNNSITSGRQVTRGVTGTIIDSSSGSGFASVIVYENMGADAVIEECNNINFSSEAATRGAGLFAIRAPTQAAAVRPIIRNNRQNNCHSESGIGLVCVIGGEQENLCNDGKMHGNQIDCTVGGLPAANALHGLSFIGCTGGERFNNKITGVSIGGLTKAATCLSWNNEYEIQAGSGSETYLYGKGAEAGSAFINELCVIPDGYAGNILQALEDDTFSLQDTVNLQYVGCRIKMKSGGSLDASTRVLLMGSGVDTSTCEVRDLFIDDGVPLGDLTNVAQLVGVNYVDINALNNTSEVYGVEQREISSISPLGSSGSGSTVPKEANLQRQFVRDILQ